jgi:hypothetical protein
MFSRRSLAEDKALNSQRIFSTNSLLCDAEIISRAISHPRSLILRSDLAVLPVEQRPHPLIQSIFVAFLPSSEN